MSGLCSSKEAKVVVCHYHIIYWMVLHSPDVHSWGHAAMQCTSPLCNSMMIHSGRARQQGVRELEGLTPCPSLLLWLLRIVMAGPLGPEPADGIMCELCSWLTLACGSVTHHTYKKYIWYYYTLGQRIRLVMAIKDKLLKYGK